MKKDDQELVIKLVQNHKDGDWVVSDIQGKLPCSMTKLLGGKEIARRYREWTWHGGGGYYTVWYFSNISRDAVEKSIVEYNGKSIWIEHWNKERKGENEMKRTIQKTIKFTESGVKYTVITGHTYKEWHDKFEEDIEEGNLWEVLKDELNNGALDPDDSVEYWELSDNDPEIGEETKNYYFEAYKDR